MPSNQGAVGIQNNPDSSNLLTVRMGKQGETMVSELHGRYYEQVYRGNMFQVASQAGVATTVGLATTYTGLALVNPIGSPVNLVLNKCTVQSTVLPTVVNEFGLAIGYNSATAVTLTSAAVPQSCLVGTGLVAKAKAAISATLPTAPVYSHFVASQTSATSNTGGVIDLEGSIILIPGSYAIWASQAASTAAAMWLSFQWEEVPI